MSRTIELVDAFAYTNLGHITCTDEQLRDNAGLLKAVKRAIPNANRVTPGKSLLNPKSQARPVIWVFVAKVEAKPAAPAPQVTLSNQGQKVAQQPAIRVPGKDNPVTVTQVQANTRQDNAKVTKVASSTLKTNRTLDRKERDLVTRLVNTGRYTEAQARLIVVGK